MKIRLLRRIVIQGSWEGFYLYCSVLVLELGIVRALPYSATATFKSLSRCLSTHVIEGPVAIYEEFYISGFTSKTLRWFQTPQMLYSL